MFISFNTDRKEHLMSDTTPRLGTLKDVIDNVKVPGETLKDLRESWAGLSEEDKTWYKEEAGKVSG
jgi:hypothetical protein